MERKALTKKMAAANYNEKGEPKGNGLKCATCGQLAAWGRHPAACERDIRGRLIVWA